MNFNCVLQFAASFPSGSLHAGCPDWPSMAYAYSHFGARIKSLAPFAEYATSCQVTNNFLSLNGLILLLRGTCPYLWIICVPFMTSEFHPLWFNVWWNDTTCSIVYFQTVLRRVDSSFSKFVRTGYGVVHISTWRVPDHASLEPQLSKYKVLVKLYYVVTWLHI
jgi:hypothetical protein